MPLWSNIAELLDYYIPPLPSVYWIDVIRECNLRCLMCPQSKGLRLRPPRMSLDTFRRIIDDVCGNRPLIKLYLSGEPLLHEGLFDMIACAGAHGCQTMIHTNAVVLTKEMAERILSSPLTFLSFSFDGCTRAVYEHLRPPAVFEQVRDNIREYLALRRQRGQVGPHTTIEVIRMRETEPFLGDFAEEWKNSGVDDVHIIEFLTWHGLVEDRRAEDRPGRPGFKPCAAPFRHGCILSDGIVVPCCLDVNGRVPLGNVTKKGFKEIWAGNDYRRFRLEMLTATFPPDGICARCDNIFRKVPMGGCE
jgi:radical SAM protein with 4Fe4S-binding SPASM domain